MGGILSEHFHPEPVSVRGERGKTYVVANARADECLCRAFGNVAFAGHGNGFAPPGRNQDIDVGYLHHIACRTVRNVRQANLWRDPNVTQVLNVELSTYRQVWETWEWRRRIAATGEHQQGRTHKKNSSDRGTAPEICDFACLAAHWIQVPAHGSAIYGTSVIVKRPSCNCSNLPMLDHRTK